MWLRWVWRVSMAAGLCGLCAYLPYRLVRSDGYLRYQALKQKQQELQNGNARLRHENRELHREIHRLKYDLATIAAVARDELGLVRPGEIIIQLNTDVTVQGGVPSPLAEPSSASLPPPRATRADSSHLNHNYLKIHAYPTERLNTDPLINGDQPIQ